jgi:molecular chaperone DnaK (HSP70)
MHLGIDFGTTRTVVACRDRGNYPVLSFLDADDNPVDWFPSVVAERRGELRFGWDALAVSNDGEWTVLRSFKRLLSGHATAPDFSIEIGDTTFSGSEVITRFLAALRTAILTRSNRPKRLRDTELVAVVATPASAHGKQRFLTLDAFRRAGFDVTGMLNEPSAAGFEYAHRYRDTITTRREHIVVYDLGGGTFDASLVRMSGRDHDAVATAGSAALGGDDFDELLADMVLRKARIKKAGLPRRRLALLVEHCREAKEHINPNSKRIVIDLESCLGELFSRSAEATVMVDDYFDRCVPLVEKTLKVMAPVLGHLEADRDDPLSELAGIYVVGGASALPVVGRVLRDAFGRRVHRSPYPSGAIAIGLAIAGDESSGYKLRDRLSRHFGVFRERDAGRDVSFDPIFSRDTKVPTLRDEAVVHRRVYRAAHNVGRYRFVECASLDPNGVPLGDITAYGDVLFPFDHGVRERADLAAVPVHRIAHEGPLIEEAYRVTEHGLVRVTITDLESGFSRAFDVGA